MTLEELEKTSEGDLRRRVNEIFAKTEAEETGMLDKPALYAEVRFYVDELERRKNDRVSIRDFRMELVVIFLIGLEIVLAFGLAIWGDNRQTTNVNQELAAFGKMQDILSHLQDSSKATADTMMTLETTTENMNGALQKQLALFYDVSVNVLFDTEKKQFTITNNGRTNVSVWGMRKADEPITLFTEGRAIPPVGGIVFPGDTAYDLLIKQFPKPTQGVFPFEIFIKNERGEEFIQHGDVGMRWQGDTGVVFVQVSSIVPESWNRIKGVSIPALTKTPSSKP